MTKSIRWTAVWFACLALLPACSGAGGSGPLVEGDPWDYNLRLEDLPERFDQDYFDLESGVITNRDVALTAGDPTLFQTANAQGRKLGHFVEFTGSQAEGYNRAASMIVIYLNAEGAAAGLAESIPAPDPDIQWAAVPEAEAVGDESSVWQMLAPGEEVVYRVDYRFRNVRGSVGVGGLPQLVPDPAPALDLARLMIDRMAAAPAPAPLAALRQERLADLRGLAMTQEDLIELDPVNGVVWYYDDNPLPQWTPHAGGPVAGYQTSFYRPSGRDDVDSRLPYGLIVTVLGYPDEHEAQLAIAGAIGPDGSQKVRLEPAGEESAGFYRTGAVDFLGETQFVATYEINMRVGRYVAGVRVSAFQPRTADPLESNPTTDFLSAFARRQAERLAAAP